MVGDAGLVSVNAMLHENASVTSRWRLDSKKAVVTGGSTGIGLATVKELMALGADVVFCARHEEKIQDALATTTPRSPESGEVYGVACDVSIQSGRDALVDFVADLGWNSLDILVNNAGTNIRKSTLELTEEDLTHVLSTNLDSAVALSRAFQPRLAAAAPSTIINIGSVAGLRTVRSGLAYGMSKAAMTHMTRYLACEWGPNNIRVNCVAPWYVETPLAAQVLSNKDYEKEVLDRTPLRRVGKPEEIAGTVAFLCMETSRWTTGQTLAVDGGFMALGF